MKSRKRNPTAGRRRVGKPVARRTARKLAPRKATARPLAKRVAAKSPAAGLARATPHLVLRDAAAAIDFYRRVFGATEVMRLPAPDGRRVVHAEIRIGESIFMLSDPIPEYGAAAYQAGPGISFYLLLARVDAVVARAQAAGASLVSPPADMFWGDRCGTVRDPFGVTWTLATRVREVSAEEMRAGAAKLATKAA